MSFVVKEPTPKQILERERLDVPTEHQPKEDLALLEDKVPESLRSSKLLAVFTAVFGVGYVLLSILPISHTDVWGHIHYGQVIVAQRAIPATEPLMALAKGVPYVDSAWLSKVLGYLTYNQFGLYGLQFLFAFAVTATCAVLTGSIYKRSRSFWGSLLGVGFFCLMAKPQLEIIRPQLAGLLCFALLLNYVTSQSTRRADYWRVPLIFVFWANLHGSFFVGLVALGAAFVGQAIDVGRRTGSLIAVLRARSVWRWFILLELAAVAVLLNPSGIGIYSDVLAIAGSPNMRIIHEWAPLTFKLWQGKWAFVAVLSFLVLYRLSPRRVTTTEFLLLAGFGALTLWSSRMMMWWGPVVGLYLGLHLAAIFRKCRRADICPEEAPGSGKWSVVVVGIAWLFFALSPICSTLLHGWKLYIPGDTRTVLSDQDANRFREDPGVGLFRKRVSYYTPIDAANYIREHHSDLPEGLMFCGYEWGDYLGVAGIGNRPVFVNSHAHLVPTEVWDDWIQIARGDADWDDKLDRYGVNLVAIEPDGYSGLKRQLDKSDTWKLVFEDPYGVSVIYQRRKPITVP
ncbi:MAG: hypothetical protein R3C01_05030 [Planctomycetaceae bacterium]